MLTILHSLECTSGVIKDAQYIEIEQHYRTLTALLKINQINLIL